MISRRWFLAEICEKGETPLDSESYSLILIGKTNESRTMARATPEANARIRNMNIDIITQEKPCNRIAGAFDVRATSEEPRK